MRNRNRHRSPPSGYEERAEILSPAEEKQAAITLPARNRNRVKINKPKRPSKEPPRPASQEQDSISPPTHPLQTTFSPTLPGTGSRSACKGQRIDNFSSRGAGTSSDQQRVASQCGKDPSDVTLFETFSKRSRPSTTDDAANSRYTGPRTKTGMSTYIHTFVQTRQVGGGGGKVHCAQDP